jgi:hypothetical protein
MILIAFTLFHVVLSLVGIGSGFVVVYGMLTSRRLDGWTALFLATTAATSVTGYLFPVHRFTPGHAIGIVSLIVLALAIVGRYRFGLAGGWRGTYAVTAVAALYLNVFVLIAQLFMKVPALKAIAPTQSAPAFQIAQLCNLLLFLAIGVGAARRFHGEPQAAAAR